MNARLRRKLIDRLTHAVNADGGWGYRSRSQTAAEPTALASLALAVHETEHGLRRQAMDALVGLQRADGAVPAVSQPDAPTWSTALAVLAWRFGLPESADAYGRCIAGAVEALLSARGLGCEPMPEVFGHDTSLVGWSWVEGTHSWVEPTAYAVSALRATGHGGHERVREGVRLLEDRALELGGWNYGNTRVFENRLRPFPATTGIALAALAPERKHPKVATSVRLLAEQLGTIRAPFSLGWGLIGLTVHAARPAHASSWLDACAERVLGRRANPLYDAVLLLADDAGGEVLRAMAGRDEIDG